jgi:transposase
VATQDPPRSAAHPFYTQLNQILDKHDFDACVEGLWHRCYAEDVGRPGLPPGRYFRLLLVGYFEGLDSERGIAWRAADSFALREFLGLVLPEAPPDHSTISRTRRLIGIGTARGLQGRLSAVMSTLLTVIRMLSKPPTRYCAPIGAFYCSIVAPWQNT